MKLYCKGMANCDEAMFYLTQCGHTRLDRGGDGVNAVELSFLRRSSIACPVRDCRGDRRNLGSMDGRASERPCNLDTGNPCRYDGLFQQHWATGCPVRVCANDSTANVSSTEARTAHHYKL